MRKRELDTCECNEPLMKSLDDFNRNNVITLCAKLLLSEKIRHTRAVTDKYALA